MVSKKIKDIGFVILFSFTGVVLIVAGVGAFSRSDIIGGCAATGIGIAVLIIAAMVGLYG